MIHTRSRLLSLALLIICPVLLSADTFTFRNDCSVPLVVQVASVQKGVLKRDQGVVRVGDTTPKMPLDSDKVITIFESKSGKMLFREVLKANKTPQQFSILPDPRLPGRVRLTPIPAMPQKGGTTTMPGKR
jgi:hypothetical protein